MRSSESGVDHHAWETRYAALDEELLASPAEALPEMLALVAEMVDAGRFEPESESAVEASAVLARARELVELQEAGEEVSNDDAFQAAAELRALYRALIEPR